MAAAATAAATGAAGAGTNGVRASKLHEALKAALDASIRGLRPEAFRAAFEGLQPAVRPDTIDELALKLLSNLRRNVELEFEHICAERAVLPKLNELDRLLEEQGAIPPEVGARTGGAPVLRRPRPAEGPELPEAEMRALFAAAKHDEIRRLEAVLADLEAGNEALEEEVRRLDGRMQDLAEGAQSHVDRVGLAAAVAEGGDADGGDEAEVAVAAEEADASFLASRRTVTTRRTGGRRESGSSLDGRGLGDVDDDVEGAGPADDSVAGTEDEDERDDVGAALHPVPRGGARRHP